MIGEDDGSVALRNTSHGHMENAIGSLDVMLLQPQRRANSSEVMDLCLVNVQRHLPAHNRGYIPPFHRARFVVCLR